MAIITYEKTGSYSGFLGNVMFQVAATIGTALDNNMGYFFPYKDYYKEFKGSIPILEPSILLQLPTINYTEPSYHYTRIKISNEKNYNLLGYYQSKKYWENHQDKIKQTFEFNDIITTHIKKKYDFALVKTNLVSIHVRRGDYLNHPDCHPVMTVGYYLDAINKIKSIVTEPLTCIVFSDDPTWCRQNFDDNLFGCSFIFSEGNTPAEDMYFMSLCRFNIMSNSSFSWWGQELNSNPDKLAIAPTKDKWYGKTHSHWNIDDLYDNNWILV